MELSKSDTFAMVFEPGTFSAQNVTPTFGGPGSQMWSKGRKVRNVSSCCTFPITVTLDFLEGNHISEMFHTGRLLSRRLLKRFDRIRTRTPRDPPGTLGYSNLRLMVELVHVMDYTWDKEFRKHWKIVLIFLARIYG